MTFAAKDHAVDRLAREKNLQRVGELNLAALAGAGFVETGEDGWGEEVARGDRVTTWRRFAGGFLDEGGDAECPAR